MAPLIPLLGLGAGVAATLSTIATVAGPVLGVMGAIGGLQESAAQSAEFTREATETRVMSGINAGKLRREARQKQSRDRTAMAEGGALAGTGAGVLNQNAVAQELDALTVEFQGEQRAKGADFQAQQAKGSVLDVFSAAVTGFNDMDPLNIGGQI